MTPETTQSAPKLVRALKLRDLILFNLVAVLGLRHLGTTARFGPGSLLMWLIAAVFFFIPQGLAVIELSSRFPKEGGIYFWTKHALGEGHGFLCGWCHRQHIRPIITQPARTFAEDKSRDNRRRNQ